MKYALSGNHLCNATLMSSESGRPLVHLPAHGAAPLQLHRTSPAFGFRVAMRYQPGQITFPHCLALADGNPMVCTLTPRWTHVHGCHSGLGGNSCADAGAQTRDQVRRHLESGAEARDRGQVAGESPPRIACKGAATTDQFGALSVIPRTVPVFPAAQSSRRVLPARRQRN